MLLQFSFIGLLCDSVLSYFPRTLDYPDLMDALTISWDVKARLALNRSQRVLLHHIRFVLFCLFFVEKCDIYQRQVFIFLMLLFFTSVVYNESTVKVMVDYRLSETSSKLFLHTMYSSLNTTKKL